MYFLRGRRGRSSSLLVHGSWGGVATFLTSSWLFWLQPLVGPSLPLASLLGQVRSLGVLSRTVGVKTWGDLWMLSLTAGELMVTVFSVCFLSSGPMMVGKALTSQVSMSQNATGPRERTHRSLQFILKLRKMESFNNEYTKISRSTLVMSLAPCSYPMFLDGLLAMMVSA